uniref:Colipase like 2 n=1 Tax=Phocoena sinus TaxID=42100 RepID=A0A8C9E7M0_PHOSS
MAAALAILAAILLPCWDAFPQFKKTNGARCSHHSECYSDCCLINLDHGAFCVPRARITMMYLPTKGAINIICPCQVGLSCIHKDPVCTRRCHLI